MSRNKDRLGQRTVQHDDPPPQATQSNDGGGDSFSFVVPTEFVDLPSEGRFYPENHPLHNQDTIEIKQMTAKEEDILTSRSLLKKGVALDRLIKSIIINKSINTDSLLVGDRNAILVAARISGYGSEYNTRVTCPACMAQTQDNFSLFDYEVYSGVDLDSADATINDDCTFTTLLPKCKMEITFKLLNGFDERNLVAQIGNKKRKAGTEASITRQLKQMVVAVNGNTEQKMINYVVENMPSSDSRHLRVIYRKATPNLTLDHEFECPECGYETEMEVPLTADFFGLTGEYMENIYEQFFFLKYQGGWSLSESYNLPIGLRTWFVKRLVQQLEKENEAVENAKKGGSKGSQTLTAHNQPAMPPHMQKSMNKRRGE